MWIRRADTETIQSCECIQKRHAKSNFIDICWVSKNGQVTIIFFIFFDKPDNQNLLEIEKEALGEYEDAYNNINQDKSFTSINPNIGRLANSHN